MGFLKKKKKKKLFVSSVGVETTAEHSAVCKSITGFVGVFV